jgi:hypothetical protein
VQIADFGTDYTGIGWLTLVLPLALLIAVIIWWRITWRRGSATAVETFVDAAPGVAAKPTTTTKGQDVAPAVVPLLPAATLLPLWLALAVTLAVIVLWWWQKTRRAPS